MLFLAKKEALTTAALLQQPSRLQAQEAHQKIYFFFFFPTHYRVKELVAAKGSYNLVVTCPFFRPSLTGLVCQAGSLPLAVMKVKRSRLKTRDIVPRFIVFLRRGERERREEGGA